MTTSTTPEVLVVDYGMGNLFSVARALTRIGASHVVSRDPAEIEGAARVILPGVGAFGDAMANLDRMGFLDPLTRHVKKGRPLLGICLGMQLLFEIGHEFGRHAGLGFVPGEVTRLWADKAGRGPYKLPHIGWNRLSRPGGGEWDGTLLDGLEQGEFAYFVHSFAPVQTRPEHVLSETRYGEAVFCSTVGAGNVLGCQFHPELSHEAGSRILENFLRLPAEP